ncbi:MAG TPA: hypothetical protein ENK47_01040 [Euryarchaeota archaeon]|nr:MAG: hypothetical protein B6U90_06440 [Thermoplasmatales archaeon ex4484_6]RLF68001.1 MAG: hypothetical protein DRN57_04975 [Thermoplasmata archaeon]HHD15275.1 hypothetical protein [Euryarchaeota archaeon]
MIAGTCRICGAPAFATCILCGGSFCSRHMDESGLVCVQCARGKKGPNVSKGPGKPGGVM